MSERATILAVDDTSESLALLVSLLTREGYLVLPADSGELALASIAINSPDLILLDVRMKGMNGLEVCKRVKANPQTWHIPIILISAFANVAEWVEGLQYGASDYVTKPFHTEELLTRVKTHIALGRSSTRLLQQEKDLERTNDRLQSEIIIRAQVEKEFRESLDLSERSRKAMLSSLEDQKFAEAQTAIRAKQQAAIAELGQFALGAINIEEFMNHAVQLVATVLEVDYCRVLELLANRPAFLIRANSEPEEGAEGPGSIEISLNSHAGLALKSKGPVIVEDSRTEERFDGSKLMGIHGIISGICTVIGNPVQPYGVLCIYSKLKRGFTENDTQFVQSAANLLASTIQRKEQEIEIKRMNRLYATLSQVNQTIVRCRSRRELFRQICEVAIIYANFSSAWIDLKVSEGSDAFEISYYSEAPGTNLVSTGKIKGCDITAKAISTGSSQVSNDAQLDDCTTCCHEVFCQFGIQSCAAFPIRFLGNVIGTINFCSAEAGFFNLGEVSLLDEVALDISYALDHIHQDEKRLEAEIQNLRLMQAIEQADEIIMITNINAEILYVNPAFERITGYKKEEAIGRNPRFLKSGEQDEEFYKEMWETLYGGSTWHGNIINKRKSGSLYTEEATISPIKDANGTIVNYVGVKRDVTEALRLSREKVVLEDQLLQSQKVEAIGRLAGGVSHDFNNLLTGITGFTQFAYDALPAGSIIREDLTEVLKLAERAAGLTGQLLAFSRRQTLQPRTLNLNDLVAQLLKMIGRLIGENIELVFLPADGLANIKADAGQLEQVLLNLAVNAKDAMPNGGKLIVETSNVEIDEEFAHTHIDMRPGLYVHLTVNDNGCGIEPAVLEHIFEPFFTTKGTGKGTGLGLATAYGIIKQHGGNIWAESEPKKGSTFNIYLPKVIDEVISTAVKMRGSVSGTETILLVEDEQAVREVTARILEAKGYHVLLAALPSEAENLLSAHGDKVSLLLTDVIMPERNGRQLYESIRKLYPNLKILFMSGYTDEAISHHGVLNPGTPFIQKPFTSEALTQKVREVLGGDEIVL